MIFQDKSIQCFDCGTTFTFSVGEQEQFASRGYTNAPKRCPSCRQERKTRQNSNGGNSYRNDSYVHTPQRQMFPAVCSECGKETEVPFEPRDGRPVYCRDCFSKTRLSSFATVR
ncbi:CxxC-x17-CxxC domain-containing protein [Chloroflexota bacterium]